jgi:uncharacterized protein
MLYAIFGDDAPDSLAMRRQSREAHLARVKLLLEEGRLVLAGPHPATDCANPGTLGFTGSLIVAEFADLAAATDWAEKDPYLATGAWRSVSVRPFVQVLP